MNNTVTHLTNRADHLADKVLRAREALAQAEADLINFIGCPNQYDADQYTIETDAPTHLRVSRDRYNHIMNNEPEVSELVNSIITEDPHPPRVTITRRQLPPTQTAA